MKKNRGFTLIELLLVVGIIVIIASLVIVSVSKARSTGRDGKRTADLSTIQLALDMYKDSNGRYPQTLPTSWTYLASTSHTTGAFDLHSITDFNKYLSPVPQDPITTSTSYGYMILSYPSTGTITGYYLGAVMEDASDIPSGRKIGANCYCIYGGSVLSLPSAPTQCN